VIDNGLLKFTVIFTVYEEGGGGGGRRRGKRRRTRKRKGYNTEGGNASKHAIGDNSDGPHINRLRVILGLDNFRGHVVHRS